MLFRSPAGKKVALRTLDVMIVVATAVATVSCANESFIRAQERQSVAAPNERLPGEAAGVDGVVKALISAFDQADIVALGEVHERRADSDLRIALVRHPDFAKKVRSVVIECGSTTEQPTLDRYIRGENVSRDQLEQVWKTTAETTNGFCDGQIYADFLAAVRDVNSKLPADAQIRVLGGHPGPEGNRSIEIAAVSVLKEPVLEKHGKVLMIYGASHFYRKLPADLGISLVSRLEIDYPGRTFVVIPVGGRLDPPPGLTVDIETDYRKFDRALKTQVCPVLVSLQRSPFRDFSAEEFLGRTVLTSRAGKAVSAFKGSTLTLGQMADVCVYFGDAGRDTNEKPAR